MAILEGRYDARTAEPLLQRQWAEAGLYEFDPASEGHPYTVDTPPPTVSGQIHIGHVYSFTHADVMIRYHRMRGEQVLYPFGFDDNGLPTERFTENARGIRARDVGRQAFIEACLSLSAEVEETFERFWTRLGLSVDWRLRYSTIDPRSRRVAQEAFIDLYEHDHVYRQEAPTLWCPLDRTAVAQADVEDKEGVGTQFSTIPFALDNGRTLPIATTRPELLCACVAVFVHPDDERYRDAVGRRATTPLFDLDVPVLADEHVERGKGTGAVMCCTFGDVTDVGWWRTYNLPLRIAIAEDGHMNELAGPYAGLTIKAARARMLDDLAAAGKIMESRAIEHTVGVHDRCGTPVEYLVASQWFVKILEHKERFLEAGRRIKWHPPYMRARYESWIIGLNWDWNISRQRYYGVPFPAWYCNACGATVLAERASLPVDPQEMAPPVDTCPGCGGAAGFHPETDVMDTWATSSLTPRICATLLEPLGISAEEFQRRYWPMTLRPNAHDIIRTWDFYTIVRSFYDSGDIPWTDVLISGHALDPAGKKISKSKLKAAEDPTAMLESFSADAVRYWATSVRTGADTLLNDEVVKNGNRLVTKLWNAAKLALPHLAQQDDSIVANTPFGIAGFQPAPGDPNDARQTGSSGFTPQSHQGSAMPAGLNATDRWLLSRLRAVIMRASEAMDDYEFATAKSEVERFFWTDLCDNYLEMVKFRLYNDAGEAGVAEQDAARYTLGHALLAALKLLAPFLPHITDMIYRAGFAATDGAPSIHIARWPVAPEGWDDPAAERGGQALLEIVEAVRRWKAERKLSVGAPLAALHVSCPAELADALESARLDLRSVTRAARITVQPAAEGSTVQVTVEQEG